MIPVEFWQRHRMLPMEDTPTRLEVGILPDTPRELLEDIRLQFGKDVKPVLLSKEQLEDGLRRLVLNQSAVEAAAHVGEDIDPEQGLLDLLHDAGGAPTVRLVNNLFLEAMDLRASDIHIEPFENETAVRLRVDGVLHEKRRVPVKQHAEISARLKVLSRLDLAENRRPQDGRLQVRSGSRVIDVRLSIVPTLYGERLVMRLLEKNAQALSLEQLGTLDSIQTLLLDALDHTYGLLLITGPTGSGKTTTLYSLLDRVKSPQTNVLTVEDPVEYRMNGVGQIQVNERIGLTFASGLRSILRQDPDVVMVGEIRDVETANIAVNAALTGHLVLSTLHTNDAPSAATRLLDLKVPAFLLSSCLLGVLAQRLVRRLCPQCCTPFQPSLAEWAKLGLERAPIAADCRQPKGCKACFDTGFRGRFGIHEWLPVTMEISRMIAQEADARRLREQARQVGMGSLLEDAARKVCLGWTSLDEAAKAARSM
jgi:general secretion pathway protein E